jgi:hypothetical protein
MQMKNALHKILTVAILAMATLFWVPTGAFAQSGQVSLASQYITFASVNKGVTSSAGTVVLTNVGAGTLTITTVAIPSSYTLNGLSISNGNYADFAATTSPSTNCGGTLAAAATCTISVTFTPSLFGEETSNVVITDNANGVSGSIQLVTLTGNGISPVPPPESGNYTFGCAGALTSTGTDYLFMAGGITATCTSNTSAATGFALTSGGYLENLYVTVNHVVTTGTDTYSVLDCSGASCTPTATGLTCTITGASALSCKDVTHTYLALAGDWITISVATSGASAATVPVASIEKH